MKLALVLYLVAGTLVMCSCFKRRECTCYDATGVKVATVRVIASSDKKAIRKCQLNLYSGSRKEAKKAIEENPPDCRIE